MSSSEPSPRGIPSIRTDWLADVARRLVELGLDRLRLLGEDERAVLEDQVDGERWRLEAELFTDQLEVAVTLDADLYVPTDGDRATLRAAFDLEPRWDAELGEVVDVRVEIGPRGAVTFEPVNWKLQIPLNPDARAPTPPGIHAGQWQLPRSAERAREQPVSLETFAGTYVIFDDLEPVLTGELVPLLAFEVYRPAPQPKSRLRRLLGSGPATPLAVVWVSAQGPLSVAWTGEGSLDAVDLDGLEDLTSVSQDSLGLTFKAPGGVLTITGPELRVVATKHPEA